MNFISRYFANLILKPFHEKTIESVLKNSFYLFDNQTIDEIKSRTKSFISNDGGFCDRAGKSDLYYSLFGLFVSEAISDEKSIERLKNYVQNLSDSIEYEGVYIYCAAILNTRFPEFRINSKLFRKQIRESLLKKPIKPDYSLFLGILTLFYQKEYFTIYRILKRLRDDSGENNLPCPVLAAKAIVMKASGKNTKSIEKILMTFYRGNGSFAALKNSPVGDLLSTAVALYALQFINADLRLIKPDCLSYIDSLYENGSFRSTILDFDSDIEYTFYGLLALGSLN